MQQCSPATVLQSDTCIKQLNYDTNMVKIVKNMYGRKTSIYQQYGLQIVYLCLI